MTRIPGCRAPQRCHGDNGHQHGVRVRQREGLPPRGLRGVQGKLVLPSAVRGGNIAGGSENVLARAAPVQAAACLRCSPDERYARGSVGGPARERGVRGGKALIFDDFVDTRHDLLRSLRLWCGSDHAALG